MKVFPNQTLSPPPLTKQRQPLHGTLQIQAHITIKQMHGHAQTRRRPQITPLVIIKQHLLKTLKPQLLPDRSHMITLRHVINLKRTQIPGPPINVNSLSSQSFSRRFARDCQMSPLWQTLLPQCPQNQCHIFKWSPAIAQSVLHFHAPTPGINSPDKRWFRTTVNKIRPQCVVQIEHNYARFDCQAVPVSHEHLLLFSLAF